MATKTKTAAAQETHEKDAAARVLRRFRVVFNAVKAHFRAVETQAGISGAQFWALSIVQRQPGIGVGGVARAMDVHQSTASNLLRVLHDAGLVISDRVGEDRRAVQLTVTPKGLRALAKAPGPFTGVLPEALRRLDTSTLARLERDLDRVASELHAGARTAKIPLGSGEGVSDKAGPRKRTRLAATAATQARPSRKRSA